MGKQNIQAKEVYWFYEQINSSARAHAFFQISLMFTARLRGEISECDVLLTTWTYDDRFSFLSLNMDKALTADFSAVYTPLFLDVIRRSRFDRRDSPERLPSSRVFYLEYPTLMIA